MAHITPNTIEITAEMMIPDVLTAHPQVRAVLDRYGLRGCGGPSGPAETIGYFALAHGVGEPQLISELNAALSGPRPAAGETTALTTNPMNDLADSIYRRFFKAGVVVVMTAGAVWGALLLLRIGFTGSFTAISIHEINAHGHAQIFGWVGLFVMGFAYQAFPRMKHSSLWRPDLAILTFYLMVVGIFARALGEPLFRLPMFREFAIAANFAEIAAIGMFVVIILKTLQHSGKPLEWHDGYIVASMLFFFVQAVYDLGLLYGTTAVGVTREKLVYLVSVYQSPLRDLQIHGFAMLMIIGVGMRMFPALFGFRLPKAWAVRSGLILLIAAVIAEVVLFILMRRYGGRALSGGLYASILVLAAVSIGLTLRWGLFAKPTETDRSTKFVRTAIAWLHTSMFMLVLSPLYFYVLLPGAETLTESGRRAVEIGFSHAYGGAMRHAITVGFISLTIMGMAAKVVPTLNGVDVRRLPSLWIPFALVNVGCLMRVTFQVATDFTAGAYPIAGVSGLLEVTGIGIWGVHLWRIMAGWRPATSDESQRPLRITADHRIGHIVEWYPETLAVLLGKGLTPLANPIARKTIARAVSVRQAASHKGLDVDALVTELNEVAFADHAASSGEGSRPREISLPVLS